MNPTRRHCDLHIALKVLLVLSMRSRRVEEESVSRVEKVERCQKQIRSASIDLGCLVLMTVSDGIGAHPRVLFPNREKHAGVHSIDTDSIQCDTPLLWPLLSPAPLSWKKPFGTPRLSWAAQLHGQPHLHRLIFCGSASKARKKFERPDISVIWTSGIHPQFGTYLHTTIYHHINYSIHIGRGRRGEVINTRYSPSLRAIRKE
jgi:hypothetical protein